MPPAPPVMIEALPRPHVPPQDPTRPGGPVCDGRARHARDGQSWRQRAAGAGFERAVHERDEPFRDVGGSFFKG